ncbi:1-acyl-sn-glycerol-3-phosphate acyltransferase [Iningainema tapete]|uniref:1-acyl-sn-glycerol-3-phosphate acyltransferase n=1 Tax=Iningainema tapete BLCC-T55 TaxID=2748662 RepID=A0A8J6XI47_9CYAN|nr:1-acyl-sn-glycerol-3-phosphate acyltransferase [Iningainema tapete BLCC-T55]
MINQNSENRYYPQSEGYTFSWFDRFCLWYPPGWLILFNRHWQHYHDDPDGWNWLEYCLFLIPGGFYLALLIRWLRLGLRSPQTQTDEFNPNYQQCWRDEVLTPIFNYHFPIELQQIENLPPNEPMIVAMNHAGMCFPWDFVSLGYLLSTQGWVVQPLTGVALFDHPWVKWWLPPGWSKVLGGVRAELDDFETAIKERKIILYAPEGLRGPRKGWRKRYQLEKFNSSFIQLSQRHQVPILPIICIGSENLHPWTVNLDKLQRLLQLPFLPLSPLMPIFLLFPSMGVWAMKTRLRYFIQSLYQVEEEKTGRTLSYQKAQQLREKLQCEINRRRNVSQSAIH